MTLTEQTYGGLSALSSSDVDTGVLHDVLANPRRRAVIRSLEAATRPRALADLAMDVAVREQEGERTEPSHDAVQLRYASLYHLHLPKLVAADVVEFDRDRNTVSLADGVSSLLASHDDETSD